MVSGGVIVALVLALWLTGYTEVPLKPGYGYLVLDITGEYRPVNLGETVWVFPLWGELIGYRSGGNIFRCPVELKASDGDVTLELVIEVELNPAVAPALYRFLGEEPSDGLGRLAGDLLSEKAEGFNTAELWWDRRGELADIAGEMLRETLTAAVPGIRIGSISLPAILDGAPERLEERRLVIVGIDALDDKLLTDFIAEGWLPNFSTLMDNGYYSVLRSEEPYFSPVIWTTIATGLPPDEHGLTDFTLPTGEGGRRPITAGDRTAPTFWEIIADAGAAPITVNWFTSWPAREIPLGVTLTSYTWEPRFTRVYSPITGFAELPYRTWPEGIMEGIDPAIADRPYIGEDDYPDNGRLETVERQNGNPLVHYLTRDTLTVNALLNLMDTRDWRVAACYVEAADVACHLLWPAHALWWERYRGDPALVPTRTDEYLESAAENGWDTVIRDFYIWMDELIGVVLSELESTDILLIISDHGFASVYPPADIPVGGGKEQRMSYWHDATGVLLMYGEGIRRGEKGAEASVYDVCPTVLSLLDVPPAADMPGKVLTEALEPILADALRDGPLSRTVSTYGRERPRGAPELSAELTENELERLRAIGYLQ